MDAGYEEIPPKKMKSEWSKTYSNKAMEMMKKMGYEKNKGLGKQSQGMLEPLTPSQHDGRRGLGLKPTSTTDLEEEWSIESDILMIPEEINWVMNSEENLMDFDTMLDWIRAGEQKYTIDDEINFCDTDLLTEMLQAKTVFDTLNDSDLRKARSRSNPFETIRNSIFLNRAAVKMANIDSLCDFMFTNPKTTSGESALEENELLYFADICAGPGGFSEYVLYRKSWEAKGFGFTLRGPNDFTLDKFFAASSESFDPFYGINGDGNVFDEDNQQSLSEYIFKHCPLGVHFVMADGGFSVDGQENIQEILSKQLYLCQCLTALKILRPNGHFVVKLFDIFTPFSVGLVYLMYKSFERIAIVKPNSSRPANSERYLVCKWKKEETENVCSFLNHINRQMNEKNGNENLIEIVDMDILKSDQKFFNYIYNSNNAIGKNQINALKKIMAFYQNNQLKDNRQAECRQACLNLWNIPDKLRQPPEVKSIESLLGNVLGNWFDDKTIFSSKPIELNCPRSLQTIESTYDWYFVPIGREETNLNACSMFLCKSRGNLLRYTNNKWEALDFFFEVSYPSLFYGEIVYEYSGEAKTQTRVCSLHIIDAIVLGGIDVRRLKLSDRMKMCSKFSQSISKPYRDGKANLVRGKPIYKLNEMHKFFNEMQHYTLKDNSIRLGLPVSAENKFFVPGGILILCEICHNFFSIMSKSRNMLYYFDKVSKQSYYIDNMPISVKDILYASFRNSFVRRLIWKWTNTTQVKKECLKEDPDLLYRCDVETFLMNKMNN